MCFRSEPCFLGVHDNMVFQFFVVNSSIAISIHVTKEHVEFCLVNVNLHHQQAATQLLKVQKSTFIGINSLEECQGRCTILHQHFIDDLQGLPAVSNDRSC